jgi:hypothetical protein
MSPTSRESVPNTALSGGEVREVIRRRCDDLLAEFGILSDQMSFGRIAFTVAITVQVDNAMQREHSITAASRRVATNIVAETPGLAAIEPAPLADASPDSVVISLTADSAVDSPNAERVRVGIPVPVMVRQSDGTKTLERIRYPQDDAAGEGDFRVRDTSAEARAAWGLPEPPIDSPTDPDADAINAAAPVYEADPLGNGDNGGVPR